MLKTIRMYRSLFQQYGVRRSAFRFLYNVTRETGLLKRRFPAWQWSDRPLANWLSPDCPSEPAEYRRFRERLSVNFFFPLGCPPRPCHLWHKGSIDEADSVREGRIRYFSRQWGFIGYPDVEWFRNPFTGQLDSAEKHWCDRNDFDPVRGDIKYIWEPSRFSWAYVLARAYSASGRDEYAETFWHLLESWMAANPPQMGPNWQCGQEVAIRVMACVFAFYTFWKSPATTDERIAQMTVFLAASAERIAKNTNYARAQMGNHATSEAAGLWTVALLFPELKHASRWRRLAKFILEDEARLYNSPDGSYTQHSMNYQRLMMHAYLWSFQLAELNRLSFSNLSVERLTQSYTFLYQLQDKATGRLPNYGPNDGSNILPLDSCDYLDYRPVIGAMHYLFNRERLYEDGPWEEAIFWLFGPDSLNAPVRPCQCESKDFSQGGYFTLRGQGSWGMVRCHSYRNRPNQADMLHLDLWWNGLNVLRDSGSFSYYDPELQLNTYFVSTAAHNTVVVGRTDQMIKGPHFRWSSLLKSRFRTHRRQGELEIWQGEHYGYQRLECHATHRRTICRLGDSFWLIVDDVLGRGCENIQLFWHFADFPYQIKGELVQLQPESSEIYVFVSASSDEMIRRVERGSESENRMGWESLYYGEMKPTPSICVESCTDLPSRFVTLVGLGERFVVSQCRPQSILAWEHPDGSTVGRIELTPCADNSEVIRSIELEASDTWQEPFRGLQQDRS